MRTDEVVVRETFHRVAAGVVAINLVVSAVDVVAGPGVYRPGFAPAVLAVLALLVVSTVHRSFAGRGAQEPLRGAVAVAVLALALHPWAVLRPVPYPPLLHALGAVITISAIASVRLSLAVVPAFALAVAVLRAPFLGSFQAAAEATLLALDGLVVTATVHVLARAARSVHEAVGHAWELAEERTRVWQRTRTREQWDGLVHDKVLGALDLASRSVHERGPAGAARALAAEALSALRGEGLPSSPAVERWAAHAGRLGLDARFRVHGRLENAEVRDAFVGAVNEVLSNVERHSGQRSVTVSGFLRAGNARIVVTDPGRGFDPASVGPGVGLRTSVAARIRAVGGDVEVRSGPGDGTAVVLTWKPLEAPARSSALQWQLRSFTPLVALAWAVLAVVLAVSRGRWATTPSPVAAAAVILGLVALTAGATALPPTRRHGALVAAGALVVALTGALDTALAAPTDWRYWYVSAMTPALAGVAYRFGHWLGLWTATALTAAVMLVDGVGGRPFWDVLTGPAPVLLAVVVASELIRAALSDAWTTVEEAGRQAAELRLALAAEAERESEAESRIAALEGTVAPALVRIVSDEPLSAADAEELELLESAVRDQLVAARLFDEELAAAVRRARGRGVDVDVVAAAAPGRHASGDCAGCRPAVRALLDHVPGGTRVRISWAGPDVTAATVTAVGAGLAPAAAAVRAAGAGQGGALQVSEDEDAVLVTFLPRDVSEEPG
ncbi:hypothetical protein Q6348_14620 [Isoptericola sp. b441]|uniref:Histidine kinase/HSP90-like ATPase domain-containing protein n=1 Tax=Actinotalea lenta TaxID=3064654 RepID=A0ABT9DDR6_9CELL|nr:ATP-binding protein [Isoptericola sp. b441]MDO8108428.1 hypothetical protein [Isoptericola sp. b441]